MIKVHCCVGIGGETFDTDIRLVVYEVNVPAVGETWLYGEASLVD